MHTDRRELIGYGKSYLRRVMASVRLAERLLNNAMHYLPHREKRSGNVA